VSKKLWNWPGDLLNVLVLVGIILLMQVLLFGNDLMESALLVPIGILSALLALGLTRWLVRKVKHRGNS
jgi:hypothetical protein